MNKETTENVKILLGDPKKAIVKLSLPMMIGFLVHTLYSIVDGIWVAGLGKEALAAVGLFMPFMMILGSLAAGIGIGGSSAISRAIGERNRKKAGNIGDHTLIIGLSIGLIASFSMLPFLNSLFSGMGAGALSTTYATTYGNIILLGSVFMYLSMLGSSVLRGEGDTKRAMYAMIGSSVLNMILDPIFIYGLNMGVGGAALSTIISMALSALAIMYWLLVKKDTYVRLRLRYFGYNGTVVREILKVGVPSALTQISMSFTLILLNAIVIMAGGDSGVAILSSGWRIVMIGIVPLFGMATAVTAVTGAAYGARNAEKLGMGYMYGIKLGTLIGLVTGTVIWIFAPQLTYMFTYSEASASLAPGIIDFLRWIVLYFPVVASGMLTSSMFQGIGKGNRSLSITLLRTVVLQVSFAYFLGIYMNFGLMGIWIGIVMANIVATAIALLWGTLTVKKLRKEWNNSVGPDSNPKD